MSRSLNSFCLASNELTPSGVMSPNAGDRKTTGVLLKVRREAGRELELFARRRANIFAMIPGYVRGVGSLKKRQSDD